LRTSLATKFVGTVTSLKLVIVTDVVLSAPVCRCRDTEVDCVVMSLAEQFHPVVAAGMVTVHAVVGVEPTPILKAAVPLAAVILAAEPPHPAPAIVGTVCDIKITCEATAPKPKLPGTDTVDVLGVPKPVPKITSPISNWLLFVVVTPVLLFAMTILLLPVVTVF
jgi:hypothetical protein